MDTSFLGLKIQNQPLLGSNLKLLDSKTSSVDETYQIPVGKSKNVRNHYNSLIAEFQENTRLGRRLNIEARAYSDGIAFRYVVPPVPSLREIRVEDESTEFQFALDGPSYPLILRNFRTNYEDEYHHITLSGIHSEDLIAVPFLVEQPGVGWVAITEAYLENYAGMYLTHDHHRARTMTSRLAPRADEPELAVRSTTPLTSPWRVLMIASDPGRLIESNIIINLNPPSAIADTSWIKPGKTAWDWWSGTHAEGVDFQPGMNTATIKHYIDFAAGSKFEFMLIDAGWTARSEPGTPADITKTRPEIDMPDILAHAKSKGVGVWLWAHWTSVERQMDEAFPLFEKWGVVGLKIDFMDRDDQWMVDFYHQMLKKAAQHRLMVDFHGAYKPDGIRRTYPNLMTREGVLALEYLKWSARATPEHNVMLAYTRMLAGPMDYTPGGFDNMTRAQFRPRNKKPMVLGTRAHQLALYVVFESPFVMVSDYPEAYKGQKDFNFIRAVPASWDETRFLNGRVGQFVTLARKRGNEWYAGSITNWEARQVEIPLEFLGAGEWVAEIYADASDADVNPKHTTIEEKKVNSGMQLKMSLASGGGVAIRLRPAT
jgi:alpha-glucosidase